MTMDDDVTLEAVFSACGSPYHAGSVLPWVLESELQRVHPMVMGTLLKRWDHARALEDQSGADNREFREAVETVFQRYSDEPTADDGRDPEDIIGRMEELIEQAELRESPEYVEVTCPECTKSVERVDRRRTSPILCTDCEVLMESE